MAFRKKPLEERRNSITNFKIDFPIEKIPIQFSISTTKKKKDDFFKVIENMSERCNRKITVSEIIRRELFKKLGIKNEVDFFKEHKKARKVANELKEYILDLQQIYEGDFSSYVEDIFDEIIKYENERDNVKKK